MSLLLVSFVAFAAFMLLLSVGVVLGKTHLHGSCGGSGASCSCVGTPHRWNESCRKEFRECQKGGARHACHLYRRRSLGHQRADCLHHPPRSEPRFLIKNDGKQGS